MSFFRNRCFMGVIATIALIAWAASPFIISSWYGQPSGPGEFGDIFGAINALFAGFALIGAIYAIMLQSDELRLQREELQLTRNEHKEHNTLVKAQVSELIDRSERQKAREEFLAQPQFGVWMPSKAEDINYWNFNNSANSRISYAAYWYINLGGAILIPLNQNADAIRVNPPHLSFEISPRQYFANGHIGRILITSSDLHQRLPAEYQLIFDFVDSLGRTGVLTLFFGDEKHSKKFQRYELKYNRLNLES